MRPTLLTLLVIGVALSTSGCGTVCDLAGGITDPENKPRLYGGVQTDGEYLGSRKGDLHGKGGVFVLGLILTDTSLSVVADTFLLPLTAFLNDKRVEERQKAEAAGHLAASAQPSANPPQ